MRATLARLQVRHSRVTVWVWVGVWVCFLRMCVYFPVCMYVDYRWGSGPCGSATVTYTLTQDPPGP